MADVQEFLYQFHNLEGITVAEKKRNLFRLFHNSAFLDKPQLNSIVSQLRPQTHLERLFLVEFLLYYKHFEELFKEFLKGDEIVINKIEKHSWFFHSAIQNLGSGSEFVTQVLPTLSYNLRLKILKRLVPIINEQQSDAIFDALLNRYGVFMATNVLTSCSRNKIEVILKNHPIKLWTSQLKLLYKKDPNLIYIYLKERVIHEGDCKFLNWDPILVFIATKNPEMFCNIQEKYKFPYCKIGKRTTKKIVMAKKENVIARADHYAKILNGARLVRTLGVDFQQVYLKLFPKRIYDALWNYNLVLLQKYPRNSQFNLFKNTFNQQFHRKLEVSYDLINNVLLKMITDNDEREEWAKRKLQHEENENDAYLQYFKAPNCIDAIKQKLDVASDLAKRIESVSIMTESCLINRDWENLLRVCQLLCTRFKNDDLRVHSKFLEILINNNFVFDNFGESHWNYIKEILGRRRQIKINVTLVIFKYFEFLYSRNDLRLEEEIANWSKYSDWTNYLSGFHESNPKSEKYVILVLIKLAPQLLQESETLEKVDCLLIVACKNYNLRKCTEKIDIFEHCRLLQSLKTALTDENLFDDNTIPSIVEWIICTKNRNEVIEELTHIYWSNYERLATMSAAKWFLRYRPELVVQYIERFLSVTICGSSSNYMERCELKNLCKMIKSYSHLAIDQKMVESCIEKLNDDNFENKTDLAQPLSIVMPPRDFVTLIEKYKPTTSTVDLLDPEVSKLFQLQRYMLKSLLNVKEPELVISLILQFCNGDYVASCLSPLYSCLTRIPQNQIKVFLDQLCNSPAVSVKKHCYYFTCMIFESSTVLEALGSCRLSQAIAMTYQHFVKNPSSQSWDLFKLKIEKLDKNDHFTNLLLINTPAPKQYKGVYFETVLDVFRKQNNRFTKVLLDKAEKETVEQLQTHFFVKIKEEFLTMHKSDILFSYYILYCNTNEKFGDF